MTETLSVKKYLQQMSTMISELHTRKAMYSCMEEFILKNGKHFKKVMPIKRGKMKECFRNAFILADLREGELLYVEGYAISNACSLPLHHAWCVDLEDNIYDPTWKDGVEYFGVPFDLDFVRKTILRRKCYGVIDNFEDGWPLLRGEENFKAEVKHDAKRYSARVPKICG